MLIQYSWAAAILPNLEHGDMFEAIFQGKIDAKYIEFESNPPLIANLDLAAVRVKTLICPDDPRTEFQATSNSTPKPGLVSPSYT